MSTVLAMPAVHSGPAEDLSMPADPAMEAFLAERQSGIGGTDAAAIAGLHPYRSLSDVVLEKKGLLPPQESNERMFWGSALEDTIATVYATRFGVKLRRVNEAWRDKDRPYLIGHPDRDVVGQPKGLEVKTVDGFTTKRWSAVGEPVKLPEEYFCQVQWYLGFRPAYTGWDLAALFGSRSMRVYPITRNDAVIKALRDRAQETWERYVVGDEMPPMDASERTLDWLRKTYPKEADQDLIPATQEAVEWYREWRDWSDKEKVAEKEKERFRAHLAGLIQKHRGIAGPGWQVTFTANKDATIITTDYEAVLNDVLAMHNLDLPAELLVKHTTTTTKPGPRVMRSKEVK